MKTASWAGMTAVLVLALASGCSNVAKFDYNEASGAMVRFPESSPAAAKKSVAVLPYADLRGMAEPGRSVGAHSGDHGSFWLGWIPLMPFGYVSKGEPEQSRYFVSLGGFDFDPANDLANATVQSLSASKLFGRVERANAADRAQSDYLWRGTVRNTGYTGYMLSYGVTYPFATGLWLLGAPLGVSNADLWLDFELVDRASGRVVWKSEYRGGDHITQWLYARNGQDTVIYADMMRRGMNGALYELQKLLPTLR